MKRVVSVLAVIITVFSTAMFAYAQEGTSERITQDMVFESASVDNGIQPCSTYIVTSTFTSISDTAYGSFATFWYYCDGRIQSTLQKKNGSTYKDIDSVSKIFYNQKSYSASKAFTISQSGTYRVKCFVSVTNDAGKTEKVTAYSKLYTK